MDYSPPDLFPGAHPHSGWGPIFIVRAMDRVRVYCRWGAASDGMATGFRSVCGCRDWRDCVMGSTHDRVPGSHGVLQESESPDPNPDVGDYSCPEYLDTDGHPEYGTSTQRSGSQFCAFPRRCRDDGNDSGVRCEGCACVLDGT